MWLRRIIFYCSATVIILAAVSISVLQLLTPLLNEHRTDFEKWVSAALQMPVTITRINVAWRQYYPVVNLTGVKIYHPVTHAPLLNVQKLSAFLSLPSSVWQRKWVLSSFLIKGTSIAVSETEKGDFIIQGFPEFKTNQSSDTPLDDMINAFANQPKVMLQAIDVSYTSKAHKQYHVTIQSLQIANNETEHLFTATAVLNQVMPTEIHLQAHWEGASFNAKQLNGKVYLYVSGLSLGQWFKQYTYHDMALSQGVMSAKSWIQFQNGAINQFQSQFQLYDGVLGVGKQSMTFNRLMGEIGIKYNQDRWIVAAKDLFIETPTLVWPTTGFYAEFVKTTQGDWMPAQCRIAYVNIRDAVKWLSMIPNNALQSQLQKVNPLHPRGHLYDLRLLFNPSDATFSPSSIAARFSNVSLDATKAYPGISRLSGSVSATDSAGNVTIATTKGGLSYSPAFSRTLRFDQLAAEVNWQKEPNASGWKISTKDIRLSNDDIAVFASGSLLLSDTTSPRIDLAGNFSVAKAENIMRYLPDKRLEKGLVEWLSQAFLKGALQSGQFKVQGALNDFPFDQAGTFLVSGQLHQVDFRYAPTWPVIHSINGALTFSGRKVIIDVTNGQTEGVELGNVSALIPYLGEEKPAVVEVTTQPIDIDLAAGTAFLMKTPLKKTYATLLDALHPQGPARLQLNLTVPLSHPDDTAVKGALSIKNSLVNMKEWGLEVSHLNGALTFTENDITADKLVGSLFNEPISIALQTEQKKNKHSSVAARFATHINVTDLEKWLKITSNRYVSGDADVSGVVHISMAEPVAVNLSSRLKGVTVDLPAPYHKDKDAEIDFRADLFAADQGPLRFRFSYQNIAGGAMFLEKIADHFSMNALTVQLGAGTPAWPTEKGLSIAGSVDHIDWNDVQAYLNNNEHDTNALPLSLPLRHIDIRAGLFSIFNQKIAGLTIRVDLHPDFWDVGLSSAQVTGRLKVPTRFSRDEIISVQLDSLALNTAAGNDSGSSVSWNMQSMPAIIFYADHVKYNQLNLGRVSFKTETANKGVQIHDFLMTSDEFKLIGAGWWTKNGAFHKTVLSGAASSNSVSALLTSFGFDSHNYILKNGEVTYDLSWNKAPFSPEFKSMSGNASLKIGKGQILEVKETSGAKMDIGRMLSVFSLQTIPRRLSLDFSDLFQSGYSFDAFRGDFSFKNGDIYTNNTHFDGPVARIGIAGTIGLIDKDYNLTLSVTPHVASSIPVAATLLTANPVVGVAVFAADKVLGSAISKATTYYYSVKGPWDNPNWQSIKVANPR